MRIESILITPEMAEKWYATNVAHNRPIIRAHVKFLAEEITMGRWRENGDTIRFNTAGKLIDGQHRLLAIMEANLPVQSQVAYDVTDDAFHTIDAGGRERKPADVLSIKGEVCTKTLAAALSFVGRYYKNILPGSRKFSTGEILELLEQYPRIRISVSLTDADKGFIMSPSILAACHYLFGTVNKEIADEFVHAIKAGSRLDETNPFYLLRERLVRNAASKAKLPSEYIMALAVKAFNAKLTNKRLGVLSYSPGKTDEKKFPAVMAHAELLKVA